MSAKYLFLVLMSSLVYQATGQVSPAGKDTVMKGATIEVIQAYKPQVKQAPKPEWVPQLPPPDTTHKTESYDDVPQQSLYYTYTSLPLHPLALGKDDIQLPYRNYIKLGAGNLSTIYLDAGIGGIHGTDFETAVHVHHMSQKGDIVNQQSSQDGLEAEGLLHAAAGDWHAAILGEQNKYFYYGYNHDLYNYSADSVKQVYTLFRAMLDFQNKGNGNTAFTWHPAISASGYGAFNNTSETSFNFDLPFAYKLQPNLQAELSLSGAVTDFKKDSVTSNNFAGIKAGFGYENAAFTGHALLGFVAGKNAKNYLLPDITASYLLPGTTCRLIAGVQYTFRQNTYEQLTAINPYMFNVYPVLQSATGEYFAGFAASSGDHFSYTARLSYWDYKNLPTFLNNSGDQKQFFVAYDTSLTAVSLQLGARYRQASTWSAGITGDFYHYGKGSLPSVWGMPTTKVRGDLTLTSVPKLTITAYLLLQGGIKAQDSYGHTSTLNTFADIGGYGEYLVIPRLSVFLQVSNLLNNRYQQWLGYQSYGLNLFGGLRLKF